MKCKVTKRIYTWNRSWGDYFWWHSCGESILIMSGFWKPEGVEFDTRGSSDGDNMSSISAFSASALSREAFATLVMEISRIAEPRK